MSNILVTGGAGFIGSHLVDRLIKDRHRVSICDDLSTGKESNINKEAKFHKIKIENPELKKVFVESKPDFVFHLAAQSQVKKSVDDPLFDARTNIMGTLNLLELSRKYNVKKFIFSSSGGVMYGNTTRPANEDISPNPISPYGISKLSAEQYIKFYAQYGLKYSILRYSNVYGPRQDPYGEAGVVAIFTNRMLKHEPCILYGFGKPIRDYVYVEDVVQTNVLTILTAENSTGADGQVLNIGTGVGTSVNELFELMREITHYSVDPVYQPKREGELDSNRLDSTRAKELLGWEPKISLKSGLEQTMYWFKKSYLSGE